VANASFGEKIETEYVSANIAECSLGIELPKLEPHPEKRPKKYHPNKPSFPYR
jgi:hypothetical protein